MQPTSNHTLPSFAELQQPDDMAFREDKFLDLVNKPCHEPWIKTRTDIQVKDSTGRLHPYRYLPIDKIHWYLSRIFGAFFREEILSAQLHLNSEVVVARLHYCIPGTSIWLFQDGIGAKEIQTDKGEAASNLAAIKFNGVLLAAPSAYSSAISNAAAKIGKVFGRDLNKDDAMEFTGKYASQETQPVISGPSNPIAGMTPAQAKHAAMAAVQQQAPQPQQPAAPVPPAQAAPSVQAQAAPPVQAQAAPPAQAQAAPPSFLNLSNAVL